MNRGELWPFDLFLVLSNEFNRLVFGSQSDKRTFLDLDYFDRYRLIIKSKQTMLRIPEGIPSVLFPEAAKVIEVVIEAEGFSALLRKQTVWDNEGQPIHQSGKRIEKPWNELAEGRSLVFRLTVRDATLNQELRSEYFRVQN